MEISEAGNRNIVAKAQKKSRVAEGVPAHGARLVKNPVEATIEGWRDQMKKAQNVDPAKQSMARRWLR